MKKIFKEVQAERDRQDEKWGEQNHKPPRWSVILSEEVGEVNKAILEEDAPNYRHELIQVAAVAILMIECLDRNMPSHVTLSNQS